MQRHRLKLSVARLVVNCGQDRQLAVPVWVEVGSILSKRASHHPVRLELAHSARAHGAAAR